MKNKDFQAILDAIKKREDVEVFWVKPHGDLYSAPHFIFRTESQGWMVSVKVEFPREKNLKKEPIWLFMDYRKFHGKTLTDITNLPYGVPPQHRHLFEHDHNHTAYNLYSHGDLRLYSSPEKAIESISELIADLKEHPWDPTLFKEKYDVNIYKEEDMPRIEAGMWLAKSRYKGPYSDPDSML